MTLMATVLSTASLIAPSASHRLRFHQNDRAWIVESANVLTIVGSAFSRSRSAAPCCSSPT